MHRIVIIVVLFALAGPLAIAQPNAVERIVAVVGKEIVLKSDVDGQIELLAQRDPKIDRNDPKLRQYILDALINERLVVSKALEDSVTASDDEVTQRMDYQIQMLVQQFGSEKRIEDIYGMPRIPRGDPQADPRREDPQRTLRQRQGLACRSGRLLRPLSRLAPERSGTR